MLRTLRILRNLVLSLLLFVACGFAITTYFGYRYLPDFVQKYSAKNVVAKIKKNKPKAAPLPQALEAPVDLDEAILMEELEDENPEPAKPEKSTQEVVAELDYFDRIIELQQSSRQPPLCEILCKRTNFTASRDEAAASIKKYFEKEQNRAFEDPDFRLAVLRIQLLNDIIPQPLRHLMLEIDGIEALSETEKVLLVARAQFELTKLVIRLKTQAPENRRLEKILEEIVKLKKKCSPKMISEIEANCQTVNVANW